MRLCWQASFIWLWLLWGQEFQFIAWVKPSLYARSSSFAFLAPNILVARVTSRLRQNTSRACVAALNFAFSLFVLNPFTYAFRVFCLRCLSFIAVRIGSLVCLVCLRPQTTWPDLTIFSHWNLCTIRARYRRIVLCISCLTGSPAWIACMYIYIHIYFGESTSRIGTCLFIVLAVPFDKSMYTKWRAGDNLFVLIFVWFCIHDESRWMRVGGESDVIAVYLSLPICTIFRLQNWIAYKHVFSHAAALEGIKLISQGCCVRLSWTLLFDVVMCILTDEICV